MASNESKQLLQLFAEIMDYPGDSLPATATRCAEALAGICPEAAAYLQEFIVFAKGETVSSMEEIYTRTFDITPTANLYAGYHLFGESYKRGAFLVRLQEGFRRHGFSAGQELADHLCVVLRFAAMADDPDFVDPLLAECVLPTIEKVEESFNGGMNGYGMAASALRAFLRQECREPVAMGGLQHD